MATFSPLACGLGPDGSVSPQGHIPRTRAPMAGGWGLGSAPHLTRPLMPVGAEGRAGGPITGSQVTGQRGMWLAPLLIYARPPPRRAGGRGSWGSCGYVPAGNAGGLVGNHSQASMSRAGQPSLLPGQTRGREQSRDRRQRRGAQHTL